MNALVLMMLMGRGMDPQRLHDMVKRDTDRRIKLFSKLADILFGIVMFFMGDVVLTVDGKTVAASDFSTLTTDQKLTAILSTQQATDKALRFREFVRPLLIAAAEFVAQMMAPDDTTLALLSGAPAAGMQLPGLPAPAAGAPVTYASPLPIAPAANPNAQQGSTGNPIRVPGNPGGGY